MNTVRGILGILVFSVIFPFSLAFAESDNKIEFLLKEGLEEQKNGSYEKAIKYFDQVLELDPKNLGALNLKGVMLGELNKTTDATQYFDKALQIDPKNVQAFSNKGAALIKLGKYDQAINNLDKALEIDPKNKISLANLVAAYKEYRLTPIYDSPLSSYVEIEVRNSEGQLVTYLETNNIGFANIDMAWQYLDTLKPAKTIEKDGKKFDLILLTTSFDEKEFKAISENTLVIPDRFTNATDTIFACDHMGIAVEKGDTLSVLWTVLKPVE